MGKIDNKIEKTEQKLSDEIKENYFKIFDLVDGLAGEVRDSRESRTIFSYRIEELEKRMEMVEKKLVYKFIRILGLRWERVWRHGGREQLQK